MPDLTDGARAVRVLSKEVQDSRRVRDELARAVLRKAQTIARTHPTPQARMVGDALIARRGVVIGSAGKKVFGSGSARPVKLGVLAYGAEFGSNNYKQFGRDRRESGYFLNPAAERPGRDADKAEESFLDRAIAAAIRAAGF